MDESAPLHRFRTIETLHDGSAGRLDLARDIVEDRHCWVLTPVRPISPVTETALWLRAASPWAGSRRVELLDVVRHAEHVHLSLVPVDGKPWARWFASADDETARRGLQAMAGFLREILATRVPAGAIGADALWCADDGEPFVLPSAWMLPPPPDTPGRFRSDHVDPRRCAAEVSGLWCTVSGFARERGDQFDTLLEELAPRPADGAAAVQVLAQLSRSNGSSVQVICSDQCHTDATTLADELRALGKCVIELEPQIRIARDVRLDAPVDAIVLCGGGAWADYAVALERLEKLCSLDGSEAVYVVTGTTDHEEDMDLWIRGRSGAREPVVTHLSPADDFCARTVTPRADHGGRVLEVLGALDSGVVADALIDAFSWQPRALARSLAALVVSGEVQVRYALHHAAPGLHLVAHLADGVTVGLDAARRDEVRALVASIAERHPDRGRGVGRQWYYAGLLALAGSSGAPERLRRLAHRLEGSGSALMAVGVYGTLLKSAGSAVTREDISRASIARAQFYQRAGLLGEARRILDEATTRLGSGSARGRHVDGALAVVTLHRARLDFHASAFAEGEHRLSVLLEETRGELPVELRSRVYVELAWAQLQLGRTRESVRTSELVLRLLDAHAHAELVARAHTQLGFALYKESDYAGSVMHYDRALRLRKQIGDPLAVARTLNNLGLSYRALEQWNEAEDSLRESLRLKTASGDELSLAASLLNLGFLLLDRSQLEEAEAAALRCVEIGQRHHHPETEAEARGLLGEIERARGNLESARRHLTEDLEICERTGHQSERLATLRRLAEVLLESGAFEDAALRLESARGLLSEQPSRLETALLDRIEADLLSHDEVFEPAISAYSAAARGFASIHRPRDQVEALSRRGAVEHRLGRIDAARATLGEVREIVSRQELHAIPGPARELESLMGAPASRESRSTAGPRTCLESLVSALEGNLPATSLLDGLSRVFSGVDVHWFAPSGEVVSSTESAAAPPESLRSAVAQCDAVELRDGWTLVGEAAHHGTLAVKVRRELDPAEEQVLKGFLRILSGPVATATTGTVQRESWSPASSAPARGLVGKSQALSHVLRMVERVAPTDVSVLILGENGTGKELVARALHERGPRPDRPFVAVNCASIPPTLLESELFGHEKGAFTSAHARRAGRFEEARDGTLLLDEIGEMQLEMQAKLLRVLQERTFTRVGGSESLECRARVIAATNRDLAAEVERGRFRMDLYYRINVVTIEIPPLRERREDIAPLVAHFLRKHAPEFGGRVPEISDEVLERLEAWHWPGNVRELENVVMNALVFATSDVLRTEDLPPHILPVGGRAKRGDWQRAVVQLIDAGELSEENPLLPRLEAWVVHEIVRRTGNKTLAAKMLGITKPTVYDRLRRYAALYGPDPGLEDEGVG